MLRQYSSKSEQIRRLLLVFGSGIALAIVLSLGMLYYYNPSGVYLAKNVLVSPESALSMRFSEGSEHRGASNRSVLSDIVFSFYDLSKHQINQRSIDLEQYRAFYQLVENDRSIEMPSDEIRGLFNQGSVASIVMSVRGENEKSYSTPFSSRVFQTVDLLEKGDYYRVQLRVQNTFDNWAYFYHPGIYVETHSKIMVLQ